MPRFLLTVEPLRGGSKREALLIRKAFHKVGRFCPTLCKAFPLLRANREIPENLSGISPICSSKRSTKRTASPGFTGVTVRLVLRVFLLFFLCVFFFRVLCVRLARQGPRRRARSTRTSSTLRVRPSNSKQNVPNPAEFPNKSTQIGEFSTQLYPKQLHNFKKTFRHYHATPP